MIIVPDELSFHGRFKQYFHKAVTQASTFILKKSIFNFFKKDVIMTSSTQLHILPINYKYLELSCMSYLVITSCPEALMVT